MEHRGRLPMRVRARATSRLTVRAQMCWRVVRRMHQWPDASPALRSRMPGWPRETPEARPSTAARWIRRCDQQGLRRRLGPNRRQPRARGTKITGAPVNNHPSPFSPCGMEWRSHESLGTSLASRTRLGLSSRAGRWRSAAARWADSCGWHSPDPIGRALDRHGPRDYWTSSAGLFRRHALQRQRASV